MDKEIILLALTGVMVVAAVVAISSQMGGSARKIRQEENIPILDNDDFLKDLYQFGSC
jgi:hypothetical protein